MKPVIGIVICGYEDTKQFVSQNYIDVIERSGALPVLLPILTLYDTYTDQGIRPHATTHLDYKRYGDICDGFLFCGGGDITSFFFGEEPLDTSGITDIKTDIFQLSLMEYVLQIGKPILAICRGMQILNVTLGGTIYQDISLRPEKSLSHTQNSLRRSDISHKVSFTQGSILHQICGNCTYTNSFHHQSVHSPGEHLLITGKTSDGIIEAIESDCHSFAVGVQWHPECMYDDSPEMQNLFLHFVAATRKDNEPPSQRGSHPSTPSS